ncbi:MAG: hypothetical protein Q9M26_05345 [Mariprofundales bacterium]|nr:hypothetical protein [Mariprofundales bacterium]
MPKLFWSVDEGKGTPSTAHGMTQVPSRAPLVVPPELQGKVDVPMPKQVAPKMANDAESKAVAANRKRLVAGKAVALDARVYSVDAAPLFSAVVDAMTALNIPVDSVDSPSGTVTSDWIRRDSASATAYVPILSSMFGASLAQAKRHRFVVRVLRQQVGDVEQSRLEVRTLSQSFINRHWVDQPVVRKFSNELFSAVEERISSQPGVEKPHQ